MAMPDPTLGRVQDTGHAGIRQGFQSIMDSLNQNSQMALTAVENWKQRDYAAQEAEKQRLFQADEALKARAHTSKENDKRIAADKAMNEATNATNRKNNITSNNRDFVSKWEGIAKLTGYRGNIFKRFKNSQGKWETSLNNGLMMLDDDLAEHLKNTPYAEELMGMRQPPQQPNNPQEQT